jgi:WS/DGAT/MGAT family acyltransferase
VTHYERLSFLDNTFLAMEGPSNPMHVGGTLVFEGGDLARPGGGIDIDSIRGFIEARLQYVPRYRQRLQWIPVERHPVWIDDAHFDPTYHIRHIALPHPGSEAQLRQMAGRILSQRLDRTKPMWEVWVAEGLADGGFALVSKVHHCMIDGIGGVDLLKVLLAPYPSDEVGEPDQYEPRPAPTPGQLFADEAIRRVIAPITAARGARRFVEETRELKEGLRHRLLAMRQSARSGWFTRASATPLNAKIGPNRRIAFLETPLEQVKAIKNAHGVTVNDVVIAAVAGAVRSFLKEERQVDVDGIDFRAMVPVSTRGDDAPGLGNRVTMWLLDLPIAEPDPVERLRAVGAMTSDRKEADHALGASLLTQGASFTPSTILSVAARVAAATARPFNMTITNVPGPQVPLYLLSARLTRIHPMVPLWVNHGLGVALFSYDGKLDWGVAADWDLVPDLDKFMDRIVEALEELSPRGGGNSPKRRRGRSTPRGGGIETS